MGQHRRFTVHGACLAAFFGLASAGLLGCDEALVDSEYRGAALYSTTLELEVFQDFDLGAFDNPRWALFVMPGGLVGDFCELRQHPDSSHALELGTTELNIFNPPDETLLTTADTGVRYALLRPLAFEDIDDDGERDDGERYLGDTTDGIIYVPTGVTNDEGPTGVALSTGFHKTSWNGPCNPGPKGTDADDCGARLGAACERNSDCGDGGQCLGGEDPNPSWPGGYCVVPAAVDGCAPAGGRLHVSFKPDEGEKKMWLQACTSDSDCREAENYVCQATLGACMRNTTLRIELGRASKPTACRVFELANDGVGPDNSDMDAQPGDTGTSPNPPNDCVPSEAACDGAPGASDGMGDGNGMAELDRICGNG